ncbi:hypothetical protein Pmani_027595 [Petrolisthes manimaculis]|uniref:Uncharacterized protein n=1 Tax=Petrolisthes manimaculis TaxID=1843537 RepID=A0AAE1P127_9EUCA|nr:hypothetical protein Pmani_027595 [Petrolisthes manimaculis]
MKKNGKISFSRKRRSRGEFLEEQEELEEEEEWEEEEEREEEEREEEEEEEWEGIRRDNTRVRSRGWGWDGMGWDGVGWRWVER